MVPPQRGRVEAQGFVPQTSPPPNSANVSHQLLCFLSFSLFLPVVIVTHAFCFFCSIGRWVGWGTSLALVPKKSVAIQARQGPSPDVAPIFGESEAGVTASLASQAPPAVVPMPLTGQAASEAKGAPLEVTAQPATEAISLPTSERTELPATLVASTTVGVA